jgi:hypothetical protein
MGTYEELDSVWSDVDDQLTRRGMTVFPATLNPTDGPQAYWPEGPIAEFLDLADRLGSSLVFATVARFEPEDVEDLASRLDASTSKTTEALFLTAEQHVGDVCEIQVAFAHQGVSLVWLSTAAWYEDLLTQADEEAANAEVVLSAERSLQEDDWIRTLAAHPRFAVARTMDQRIRVAEQIIPQLEQMSVSPDPWARMTPGRVVRAAWDLYLEEIQPEQERSMATEAWALLQSGARKYEVAGRLGITGNKLNRILARYGTA